MNLTVTEFVKIPCSRCGGRGKIAAYQHMKAGECFRCDGSGSDPHMPTVTRPMTDAEVMDALAAAGFPVIEVETPTTGNDWIGAFFGEAAEAKHAETMKAARALLAAI